MADFNNLTLTASGIIALLEAQAGTTLTLTKVGMGSGSTNKSTNLTSLVKPEVMMPISEKRIDEESGFISIVAKMTNQDITEGFYWRETGLFFKDAEGNDVLFAYACVIDDQYDYVPAYSDKRYVKHVRIANIITDSADITIEENEGLMYVDVLTFDEYKKFVAENYVNNTTFAEHRESEKNTYVNKAGDTMTGNGLYMADGFGRLYADENVTQIEHFSGKKDNQNRRQLIVNKVARKGASAIVISDWENGKQTLFSLYGTHFKPTPQEIGSESMSALSDIGTNTSIKETIRNYYANGVKSGRFFSPDNVSDNPEANWSFGIEFFDCGRYLVLVKAYKTQVYMTYYRQLNIETGEYLYDWVCDFNTGNKPTPAIVEAITYGTQRILINENEDLNNYLTCGGYKCINNTTVQTLANCPTDMAFTMDVLSGTGATDKLDIALYSYIVQNIRTLSGEMWYREVNSNASNRSIVYGEWKRVATHDTVPVNNNILINSNFANPVNQRGIIAQNSTEQAYWIDRWCYSSTSGGVENTVQDGYISSRGISGKFEYGAMLQKVEFLEMYKGKTLTMSLRYKSNGKSCIFFSDKSGHYGRKTLPISGAWVEDSFTFTVADDAEFLHVYISPSTFDDTTLVWETLSTDITIDVEWVKLEFGDHATPYVPRLYAEELELCKRYYFNTYSQVSGVGYVGGISENGQSIVSVVEFPVEMRISPTVKIRSLNGGKEGYVSEFTTSYKEAGNGKMIANVLNNRCFFVTSAEPQLTRGVAYSFAYTADAEL